MLWKVYKYISNKVLHNVYMHVQSVLDPSCAKAFYNEGITMMHIETQEVQVHMLLLYSTTTPLEKKAEEFSQVLPRC